MGKSVRSFLELGIDEGFVRSVQGTENEDAGRAGLYYLCVCG